MFNENELIAAALSLFNKLQCSSGEGVGLASADEDKMRCHIINCLTALRLIQIQNAKTEDSEKNRKYKSVKRKIFRKAISLIIEDVSESDSDQEIVNTILFPFPDLSMINDERSWLPMHFAIALNIGDEISEDDVFTLLSADPLSMHRLSKVVEVEEDDDEDEEKYGCTPAHILCMQKQPKMSLLRDICLRDPEAFVLCDQSGRCALHLAAQYSESLALVQFILQIDTNMTNWSFREVMAPLSLLCRRLEFPTFDKMVKCLIEVDSSVEVVSSGIIGCFRSFNDCLHQDVSIGSRGEKSLILLGILLDANPAVTNYDDSEIFHEACYCLRGELGISVLTLLLSKDAQAVKVIRDGNLPVHVAAKHSCLEVLKFLLKAYPQSISMLGHNGNSLLHQVAYDRVSDPSVVTAKMQYLSNQFPALLRLKDGQGCIPLHCIFATFSRINFECVKFLCDLDPTLAREKDTLPDSPSISSGELPLHYLLSYHDQITDVSDEGDCVRYLLRLYPEAAGIKDSQLMSPYNIAVVGEVSITLQRCMLSADPTIDPVRRRNLNFEARSQAIFLAFRALSSNVEPTIWAKIRFRDRDLLKRVISYL
jgi:ankyrin repeat protein